MPGPLNPFKFGDTFHPFGGGHSLLPYTFDPSALPDGPLPSPWVGAATWTISGGKIINTPAETAANIITNGDMETGDPPTGWTPGNATVAADADCHSGSQALKCTSTAAAGLAGRNISATANIWYVYNCWVKRTSGQIDLLMVPGTYASTQSNLPYHLAPAAYTNYRGAVLASAATISLSLRGFDNGTVAYWDDLTAVPIANAEIFKAIDARNPNCNVKAGIVLSNYSPMGVVSNLDSVSLPKYYVLAVLHARNGIGLFKCVNGTITELINSTATYVSGAQLEIRKTAADVYQLWYNGVQIGADQTVTDAVLNNNTLYGTFGIGGGSQVQSFFVGTA